MSEISNQDRTNILIGNLLSNSHELIKKILKRISFYSLLNAIHVCYSWSKVGNSILQKQRRLRFTTICLKEIVSHSDNKVTFDCEEISQKFFNNVTIKPSYCIGICCQDINYGENIITKEFSNGVSLPTVLKSQLPEQCEVILLPAYGIVGSFELSPKNNSSTEDQGSINDRMGSITENHENNIENFNFNNVGDSIEYEDAPFVGGNSSWISPNAVSLLLLNEQPGVEIKMFSVIEKEFYKTYRPNLSSRPKSVKISESEFNSVCELDASDELKAFLIFTTNLKSFTRAFISAAQNRHDDQVAIGGGILEELPSRNCVKTETIGITIRGANVRTASVVIPSRVRNGEELIQYFQKLKNYKLPESHSVCFMFSCCGRGSHWYGRNKEVLGDEFCNIETRAFRNMFPTTPVFGFFGGGEIGNNFGVESYCGNDSPDASNAAKRRKKRQKLFHQYSTVFVFVSFL